LNIGQKAVYQTLDCDLMEHDEKIAIPIIVRLSLFVAIPIVHWLFHEAVHKGIASAKQFEAFERITKRYRFLPDVLLVLALIGFHYVME